MYHTHCYCIYCPNHPLFEQRHKLGSPVTGFDPTKFILNDYKHHGAFVDCLEPKSSAFHSPWNLDPDDFDYPVTAYGDGVSETGLYTAGLTLHASCGNETYIA